eukprot:COSAG02_NODE_36048_length_459_cov_7.527778_1_plen_20_part_10
MIQDLGVAQESDYFHWCIDA